MKLKQWAKLLMTGTMVFSSISGAQMQGNWGMGMYGGMQPCPWGGGAASGASSEDDELAELKQDRIDLRRDKRQLEKMISQLERDRDRLKEPITSTVKSAWADIAFYHMEYGMNCCIAGAPDTSPQRQQSYEVIRSSERSSSTVIVEQPAALAQPIQVAPPVERPQDFYKKEHPNDKQDNDAEMRRAGASKVVVVAPAPAPEQKVPEQKVPEQKAPREEPVQAPIQVPTPAPVQQTPTQAPEPNNPAPAKNPGDPCTIKSGKKSRKGTIQADGTCLSSLETPRRDRMPASELAGNRRPAAADGDSETNETKVVIKASVGSGPSEAGGDPWGDLNSFSGASNNGDGSKTLCYESKRPYVAFPGETKMSPAFQAVCKGDGNLSDTICRNRYFQQGEIRGAQAQSCASSLARYRKLTKEIDKAKLQVGQMENEITDIGFRIGDLKMAARYDRDLEADCPSGTCHESGSRRRSSGSRGPSTLQTVAAVGLDLLGMGLNYYGAKEINKKSMEWGARTGNQAMPAVAPLGGYFPYATASMYGGMFGGMNGSFGCSPMMGGGGAVFGPMGMTGPYGAAGSMYGGVGGAFGYPQGYGFPQMGGGMYMPGAGSWGMNGPWGTGSWPGGYPGGGLVGGISAGIAGGYAGMPGYAGGYAGMPGYAGGYAGMPGYAGGFAGMPGYAGGYAGMPGYAGGYAGMPGYAGGIAGGIAGGFAGMPGYAGGYAGMPGMAGGIAGGVAGGYAGMPGYAGGIAGGIAGGLAGMPGMAGGFLTPLPGGGTDAYSQQQALQLQLQQYQLQIEAQRRYQDQAQSRLRLYQGFMQEYSQFQMKWQQAFGSGGLGGGIDGGGIIFSPGSGSGTLPGGSGPSSGTQPGRTR